MRSRTQTSTTLLEGLKDAHNRTVWAHYVDRYRPLILSYLRRLGLTAADGEDVSQEALFAFAESYRAGSYDRQRGKLRDWLQGIVRHKLQTFQRNRQGREHYGPFATSPLAFIRSFLSQNEKRLWKTNA
jgi:DNA-directed RNA polymerase specialized sigma24 family protein